MKRLVGLLFVVLSLRVMAVPVDVEEQIEFVSAMCRIAGYEEYHNDINAGYVSAIDSLLSPYRDSEAVTMLREVRGAQGVSFDAVATLVAHTAICDGHFVLLPGADVSLLDERWHSGQDAKIVKLMDEVYRACRFHDFYLSQASFYDKVVTNARRMVSNVDLDWLSNFFGVEIPGRIAVSLLNVGNYGATCRRAGQADRAVIIVGCSQKDDNGVPVFHNMESLIVHEFSHPVCNPIIDKNKAAFNGNAALTAQLMEDELAAQAYAGGHTVLCESMVRAVEEQYALAHATCAEDSAEVMEHVKMSVATGFFPLPEIVDVMSMYIHNRNQYTNLYDVTPQLVAAINEIDVAQRYCDMRRGQPRIIGTSIPEGTRGIKADDKFEIKVYFDKPIVNDGFAGDYYEGKEDIFPMLRGVRINDDARVLSIFVKTSPGKEYGFVLQGWVYKTTAGYPGLGKAAIHFFTAE